MRSSAGRIDKYSKKLRALVLPEQTANYAPTAADSLHLEYCVKKEAITPMLQFSYVAYLEELIKHEANKRPEEAAGIYNKWLSRGLDNTLLQSTATCIGVTIVPIIPCEAWDNQEDCEEAGCYWYDDACHSEEEPVVCAWSWKRKLTFSGNVSATNLDDFPILVHLTVANFDFNKAQALGQDIRFMDSDTCPSDGTPLKHEIELWDKPGLNAWVWVKVPRINGGTVNDFIYMFYGNGVAADGQDAVNVWTANYEGVYHLRNTNDSTANGFHGVAQGNAAPTALGKINGAYTFDGTLDAISLGDRPEFDGNSALTAMGWIRHSVDVAGTVVAKWNRDVTNRGWILGATEAAGDEAIMQIHVANIAYKAFTKAYTFLNQWHLLTGTYDGETLLLYVDGALADTNNAMSGNIDTHNAEASIGAGWRLAWNFWQLNGRADEVRIASAVKTPDWIMAQFKSQDETLITYGAEEAV